MTESTSLRVAFWNTWLLRPRLWAGGPAVPGGDRLFAPDVTKRAPLVGAAIRDRFDVCALSEVFEASEQQSVKAAFPHSSLVAGPGRGAWRTTSSGLATVVDERSVAVTETQSMHYRADGDRRDSDTFASKGAMLVRVSVGEGLPELDLFSTHLFAGGDLLPLPGANDRDRQHKVRMAQMDELVDFVSRHRRPENALLVVGDFNVNARNYGDLAAKMAPLGVVDLWAEKGVGAGHTCTFDVPADLPQDPSEPDQVVDDPELRAEDLAGERIDYLWFAPPTQGDVEVTADRPRRWAFSGRDAKGGPAGSLSDHLCLSTTLRFSR